MEMKKNLVQLITIKMALTQEEREIIEFGKSQGKTKEEAVTALAKYRQTSQGTTAPTKTGFFENVKSLATGFAKGVGTTAQGIQDLGQRTVAAIDPTKNLEEIRETTGSKKLAEADFSAKNNYEKTGKTIEFVAELLFPVGKATGAGRVLAGSLDNLAEKASTLSDDVVEGGVKVKDRLVELASKLDDKTKTALQRTDKTSFDKVVEQGRQAMTDDRLTTPIENVGKELVNQAQKVKNRLNQIGKQKSEVLNKAKNAYQDVSKEVGDTILQMRKNLDGLGEEDLKFVNEIIGKLQPYISKKGSLKDVDSLIDTIQDNIYKLSESDKAVQLTDRAMSIVRGGIEGLNKKIQVKVGGSYQNLNQKYSELYRLLTDVNRAVGRKGERAGSFMKQFFSPAGQTAKNLVVEMEKVTGVDFSRDARLAKFVMEAIGDKRVESLLEQIPKNMPQSTIDAVGKFINFAMEKTGVRDPIEAAKLFIDKYGK